MTGILVTGGAGFIGSHISLVLLKEGFNVFVVDSLVNSFSESIYKVRQMHRNKNPFLKNDIYFFRVDICNLNKFEEIFKFIYSKKLLIDGVIHLAGFKSISESIKLPSYYWTNNIVCTKNLVNLMKKYGCRHMVFSSSASIYGEVNDEPVTENIRKKPTNPYAETKLFIEDLLEREAYFNNLNFKIISLRYFNPIGAHKSGEIGEYSRSRVKNIFPIITKAALDKSIFFKVFGNDWPTKDGTCIRDYIHVMDLAEAHLKALGFIMENEVRYLGLNIGTGKPTTVLDLLETFEKVNKVKISYKFVSRREGDAGIIYAKTNLSKKLLNWTTKRSLEEMCKDGWKWIKQYPNGYNF